MRCCLRDDELHTAAVCCCLLRSSSLPREAEQSQRLKYRTGTGTCTVLVFVRYTCGRRDREGSNNGPASKFVFDPCLTDDSIARQFQEEVMTRGAVCHREASSSSINSEAETPELLLCSVGPGDSAQAQIPTSGSTETQPWRRLCLVTTPSARASVRVGTRPLPSGEANTRGSQARPAACNRSCSKREQEDYWLRYSSRI